MIIFKNNVFKLDTKNTSYVFSISKFNHLVFQYYGERFFDDNLDFVLTNIPTPNGTTVIYDDEIDPNYSLDLYNLEYSCFGKGDFKNPSLIGNLRHPDYEKSKNEFNELQKNDKLD